MRYLLLLVWLTQSLAGRAQDTTAPTVTLTGVVTDAVTHQPIPFASVYLNASTRGTTADGDGRYRIPNVAIGTLEIVASAVGYKPARLPLRLTSVQKVTVNLVLTPSANQLAGVGVTAKHSKGWQRQFGQFRAALLGETTYARKCKILNPQVIEFSESKDRHLKAGATEPLVIENLALGYRLYYDLMYFDTYRATTYYAGNSRFELLTPENAEQAEQWKRNQQKAYRGSTRQLLASLIAGTHEQAGFLVYQTNLTVQPDPAIPIYQFAGQGRAKLVKADSLFKPGELAFERELVSSQPLEIFYTRSGSSSPYRDMPYAYSLIVLPRQKAVVRTDGWVTQPMGLEIRGSLSNDRLATMLPADWQPADTNPVVTDQPLAEGKLLPPDQRLDSLSRVSTSRQPQPVILLHADKGFYATGDRLWVSGYVLDPVTYQPVARQFADVTVAVHVDLVTASGRLVQHQWVPIKNGRLVTTFRLSDSLVTGSYRLRAYTQADRYRSQPTFERTVWVINGRATADSTALTGATSYPSGTEPSTRAAVVAHPAALTLTTALSPDSNQVLVQTRAAPGYRSQVVYVLVQSRGQIVQQTKVGLQGGRASFPILTARLAPGIAYVTLFDSAGQRRAGSAVVVPERLKPIRGVVSAGKATYQPRESVALSISLTDGFGESVRADLSVSVTDADQLPPDSTGADWATQLVLAGARLNPEKPPAGADSLAGIVVTGRVVDRKNQSIPNAKLLITFTRDSTDSFARSAQTDAQGRFQLDGLLLTDTVRVLARILTDKFQPLNAKLLVDPPGFQFQPSLTDSTDDLTPDRLLHWWRLAQLRQATDPGWYRERDARLLSEVVVRAAKPTDERTTRRFSLHGTADAALTFDETAPNFTNVYDMIRRLPGVSVTPNRTGGYSVLVRGPSSFGSGGDAPLFIVDGVYVSGGQEEAILMTLSPSEVERIELVKNGGAAIYGARGGAGVIAIFLRKWKPGQVQAMPGVTMFSMPGFLTQPLFPTSNALSASGAPPETDRRDVLAWQPVLPTDAQGQATLQVPLSDVARRLRVSIRGITADGQAVAIDQLIPVR